MKTGSDGPRTQEHHMVIDLWVNSLSEEAAAAFLGQSGFGSVEGLFGVDVRQGLTPLGLVAEMDPAKNFGAKLL